jgi:hypothetical protein
MKKYLWLALCFLPILAFAGSSSSWSLVQSGKENIDIYKRQLSGDKEPEIKGVGNLPATPDQVLALITDIPKYAKLLHGISKAEVLKSGTDEVYVYFQCDFPWPASDRDYVAHYKWEKKGDGYLVSFSDANYWRPDVPRGFVRIETVRGSWLLEPNTDGTTKATYIFLAEYGGSLPEGIKKDAQSGEQVELFKAVRKSLSKK